MARSLDDILRIVQGLIAKADSTQFPAEADAFRSQAEALMFKYRIDEMTLTPEEKSASAIRVVSREVKIGDRSSEYFDHYLSLAVVVARHFEIRGVGKYDEDFSYVYHVFGYESDIRFFELMLTSAFLAFGGKLEPKVDPSLSDQENAYNMRSAGMEGKRIAMAIYGRDDKPLRVKVRKMFADEAAKRGEDASELLGRGNDVRVYRKSYSDAFVNTFAGRLRMMRSARGAVDHSVVLASRKDEINEAIYAQYPRLRPNPNASPVKYTPCPKCANAKSGACRDHSYGRSPKPHRFNETAARRGADAARSVDLGITGREVN